jgi:hypothetical protein
MMMVMVMALVRVVLPLRQGKGPSNSMAVHTSEC